MGDFRRVENYVEQLGRKLGEVKRMVGVCLGKKVVGRSRFTKKQGQKG